MNSDRELFARVTLNDTKIDLGRSPNFNEFARRLLQEYTKHRYTGENFRMVVEASYEKLSHESILSREQQLESEFMSLVRPPSEDEEAFPGISTARAVEAMSDITYDNYRHVCFAANRIGVPEQTIADLREAYRSKFPDVFEHTPIYQLK